MDYLNYKPINNDRSYGAHPDGTPARRQGFYFATPGAANNTNYPATPVYINEWMAGNGSALADPVDGDLEDWFELFNAGPTAVDLSGFYLTDEQSVPMKWAIPTGVTIAAGGYLLVWADEETIQNGIGADLHANFKLGLGGEFIGLVAPNGSLIDSVTFGQQTNDVSQGRWPNGNTAVYFMTAFTPRDSNIYGAASNAPPVLSAIGGRTGKEGSLITFTAAANDPDPGQHLTFSLDAGFPPGASIHAESGVFTWTPTEAQGPGSYSLAVRVTDDGSPSQSDFEPITITVSEVNVPPSLAPIGSRSIDEGSQLTITAIGSDYDQPAQVLRYSLDTGAPSGASIDPITGTFTWTPTESQGPGNYFATIIVSDNGSPSLNASEAIAITVGEVNSAPVLADINDQTVTVGAQIILTNSTTDLDLPLNLFTYSLDPGAPAGAVIDPASGIFRWQPSAPGVNGVTVRVTDNGSTSLSDSESFVITVTAQPELRVGNITVSAAGDVTLTWSSVAGKTYRVGYKNSLHELTWMPQLEVTATGSSTSVTFSNSGQSQRYYRLELL